MLPCSQAGIAQDAMPLLDKKGMERGGVADVSRGKGKPVTRRRALVQAIHSKGFPTGPAISLSKCAKYVAYAVAARKRTKKVSMARRSKRLLARWQAEETPCELLPTPRMCQANPGPAYMAGQARAEKELRTCPEYPLILRRAARVAAPRVLRATPVWM